MLCYLDTRLSTHFFYKNYIRFWSRSIIGIPILSIVLTIGLLFYSEYASLVILIKINVYSTGFSLLRGGGPLTKGQHFSLFEK